MITPKEWEVLRQLQTLWPNRKIVVVGAAAVGFHIDMRWRRTADLDIAVALDIEEFPGELNTLRGWEQDPRLEHRWHADGIEVDILPAGSRILEKGSIVWPKSGVMMNMIGFDLAFELSETHPQDDVHVEVPPVEVLTILKMAAYLDRPTERTRDLGDIAHLMSENREPDDDCDRRFLEPAVSSGVDFDLLPAYLLGLDVGTIAREPHQVMVKAFVQRVLDDEGSDFLKMVREASILDDRVRASLLAFVSGYRLAAQ